VIKFVKKGVVYFLLFNISDETKEEAKKYDLKKKK